jgi:hypothetical protein
MAAKGEVKNELRQGEVSETNAASEGSDSVDALVSSFLAELTDISSEMKTVRQSSVEEVTPAVRTIPPEEKQAKLPPPYSPDKEALSESQLDLEGINNEVEKSLAELENLKAKVIPIADRKEFKGEPESPAAARQSSEPVESTARSLDEKDWNRLDIFQATVSTDGSRRRRKILFILTAAVLVLILGYFYLFHFNRITPAPDSNGQIPESEAKQLGSVAAVSQKGFKPASISAADTAGTARVSMVFNLQG